MDTKKLRSLQTPLKARYREKPEAARITLKATGRIDDDKIACKVDTAVLIESDVGNLFNLQIMSSPAYL